MKTISLSTKTFYLLCLFVLCCTLSAQTLNLPPKPSGAIADNAQIIDAATQQKLNLIAQALWEQAEFGLVVATLPSLENETIEGVATQIYDKWGIGGAKKDEGALILISLSPRKARIEVGYGAEGYLNDAKVGRLLDQYGIPYFKTGDFSSGVLALSGSIASAVAQEKNIQLNLPSLPAAGPPSQPRPVSLLQLLPILLIFLVLASTRTGRGILLGMLLSSLTQGRGGGGFGGGFGSGGFGGGFGGGSSGGGGASRGF